MPSTRLMTSRRTSLQLLAAALLLVPCTGVIAQHSPAASQASTAAEFGAIAFTADGSFTAVWKRASKGEAEAKVLADCAKLKRGACEVVGFRQELCAAIASFRTPKDLRVTYAGGGVTRADAERSALERCNRDSRARRLCRVRTVVCGDGR